MWWIAAAFAEEPALEVIVAEQRLSTAKEHVARVMKGEGYFRLAHLGHRSYWISGKVWKPWVMLHDEGFARVRGVAALPLPGARTGPPLEGTPVATTTFITQSRRARRSQKERMVEQIEPALAEVREALWDIARAERLQERAERLVRIWFDTSRPAAERRADIVREWLGTEPDEAGQGVRALIERFIDDEVQTSEPFTDAEVAAANAARGWPGPLEPVAR
jgi:hypothetical protein